MKLIRTPRSIEIDITNRCNLRCRHCFHFTSALDVGQDLPAEEWLNFFGELSRLAVLDVTLGGGEPFCRADLKELIKGIVKNKMRFSILTNGTLITDSLAAFIASTGRYNHIQVSIDGSTPETHNSLRGKGNFEKAIDGIMILKKYQISISVRVTVFRNNIDDLENIARLLLEEIELPSFSTNSAFDMGLCRQNAEMVQLTAKEYSRAMEVLLELNEKYGGRIGAFAGPLAAAKDWLKMEKARKAGKSFLPERGKTTACGGVFYKLGVRADGVIVPCNILGDIELGKINQVDLMEIWQNHPKLNELRELRNIPLSDLEFCKGCDYINYCHGGGCPATIYTNTSPVRCAAPDSCLKLFLEAGGRLPDENFIAVNGF